MRIAAPSTSSLVREPLASQLLESARFNHERGIWFSSLFLLMPDHIHALLAFPADESMSKTVGEWKKYASRHFNVEWQPNFFDHRIRSDRDFAESYAYILRNPVAKGLCALESDWPYAWIPQKKSPLGTPGST